MNTTCIIIIVLIIVILLLLLCSYFIWCNKPKKQLEKTNGSSNIKIYGNIEIESYLNTTVEPYLTVICYDDNEPIDIIVKIGGLSEKGNEYNFISDGALKMDRTYDEFRSHLVNIKKLSKIINKQLFWHHVCIFNSFGKFQNVRDCNDNVMEAGSSSLSGLLETIGHYITLNVLYKYCEDQIILISDNNFDKIEYDNGVGLYGSVAAMLNEGTNKLKKASFIQNIKQFSSVDNNLEFYIARFKNPKSIKENIKKTINDIIESIISGSKIVLQKLFETDSIDEIDDEQSLSWFNNIKLLFNITEDEKLINHICAKSRPRNKDYDTFMSLIQAAKAKQNPDQQLELKMYVSDVSIIRTTIEDMYPSLDENIREFHIITGDNSIKTILNASVNIEKYSNELEDKPENNIDLIIRLQTLYNSLLKQQTGSTYEKLYKSEETLCCAIYYLISHMIDGYYIDDAYLSELTENLYAMQNEGTIDRYYLTDCFDKLIYGYILFTNIKTDEYKDKVSDLLRSAIRSESYDDYIDIFSLIIDTNETGMKRYIEKSFEVLSMFIDNLNSIPEANNGIIKKSVDSSLLQDVKQKLLIINDFANASLQLMKLQSGNLEEDIIEFEDSYIFDDEYNGIIVKYFTDLISKYIYIKRYIEENGEEDEENEKENQLKRFVIEKVDNNLLPDLFSFANNPSSPDASDLINQLRISIGLLDMIINIIDNCFSNIDNDHLQILFEKIDEYFIALTEGETNYEIENYETYIERINMFIILYSMKQNDKLISFELNDIVSFDNKVDSILDSIIQSHKFSEFFDIVFNYYIEHYENPMPDIEFIENVKEILSFIESHNNSIVYNPILAYLEVYTDCLSGLPYYINIYNIIICIHNIMVQIEDSDQRTLEAMQYIVSSIEEELVFNQPLSNSAEEIILQYKQSILNYCLFIMEKQDQQYNDIYTDVANLISDTINPSNNDLSILQTISNFMIAFKSVFYYILVNSINDARIMIRQAGEDFYRQYYGYYNMFIENTPKDSYTNIKALFDEALKEPDLQTEQPV